MSDADESERNVEEIDKNSAEDPAKNDDDDDEPAPGDGLSEEIYEVERILDHYYDHKSKLYFKVRWLGYNSDEDSFEPAENLGTAAAVIADYWKHNKTEPPKSSSKTKEAKKSSSARRTGGASKKKTPRKSSGPAKPVEHHLDDDEDEDIKSPSPPPTEHSDDDEISGHKKKSAGKKKAAKSKSRSASPYEVSDDEEIGENKKKSTPRKKPVSKAELKSYENTPTVAVSQARKKAQEHRQGWLYEEESSDDDNEEKKQNAKENKQTKDDDVVIDPLATPSPKKKMQEDYEKETTIAPIKRKAPSVDRNVSKKKREESIEVNGISSKVNLTPNPSHSCTQREERAVGITKEKGELMVMMKKSNKKDIRMVTVKEAFEINGWSLVEELLTRIRCVECDR